MAAIDYWCNAFTQDAMDEYWHGAEEIAAVIDWWGLAPRIVGRTPTDFLRDLDDASVEFVLIPSVKMRSFITGSPIWNTPEAEVANLIEEAPDRMRGLYGIDPLRGMEGVRQLEAWVRSGYFLGSHLHTYGFGLPIDHRRYYPFYAKCVELDVPVVIQVGHSAERMPSELARPILLDNVALDFPDLKVVAAHTGWPWVEELIALAWKHPHVYIGTSAHHPRFWDDKLVRFLAGRGQGKVLFGTDYPVLDHAESIAAIDLLELPADASESLLHGACRRVFGLDDLPRLTEAPVPGVGPVSADSHGGIGVSE